MAVYKFKTTNIKGKPYVEVNEKIKFFRMEPKYKGWAMITRILEHQDKAVLMQATIYDEKGSEMATGYARERDGDGFINKTSYIENCETSAWGRALSNLGIGIDTSIASSEEVQNAIMQQEAGKIKDSNKKKPAPVPTGLKEINKAMYERMNNALGQGMVTKVEESLSGFKQEGKWFDAISLLIVKAKSDAEKAS